MTKERHTAVPVDITAHVIDVDHVCSENVIYHNVQPTDTIQGLCIRVSDLQSLLTH